MEQDKGGGGQSGNPTDLRARQADIKRRLQLPIPSHSDLWSLILSPLDLLQIVPPNLPQSLRRFAIWQDCSEEDKRLAQKNLVWISDVQKLLIEKVFVDWKDVLEEQNVFGIVLQQWFAPTPSTDAGSVYIATLSTLSVMLSDVHLKLRTVSKSPESEIPTELIPMIMNVLRLFSANLSLTSVVENLEANQSQAKRHIVWNDVVRELSSLPDRVANATEGKAPRDLERGEYVKTIAVQFEVLMHHNMPIEYGSVLLSKLLRSGYLEETTSDWEEPVNIWPTVMRHSIKRNKADLEAGWSRLLQSLPSSALIAVGNSLISFVDRYSLKKGGSSSLLSGDELLRPGAEGSRFLAQETWQKVLSLCIVIGPIVPLLDNCNEGDAEDSEEDETLVDEEDLPLLVRTFFPSSKGYWSPLTARLLVHLLFRRPEKLKLGVQRRLLRQTIDIWSLPSRIKTAIWEQEIYLTTVLLLLIAQVSKPLIADICTSSNFINGVSTHLEHLSPSVRRMGMLVAEVASTANGSDKTLNFSRAIWDGKGEGKEEARVLRAMFQSWNGREMDPEYSDQVAMLSSLELVESTNAMVSIGKDNRIGKEKKAPRTRTLPAKKMPPSRPKPLIQSLDDEGLEQDIIEQYDGLPSLTNIQTNRDQMTSVSRPVYVSEGEESSSSESDSSDSEVEGRSSIPTESEKKEEFGLGMPQKKKKRVPIYIHQLAPLLRESERESNKLALKHTESLVDKKAQWGGEVDENAVNLSLALLALQNNYGFKRFEERKRLALTALVVASPALVGPCLCEQYFTQQYSITQRVCILNSLAFGARKLSFGTQQGKKGSIPMKMSGLADEFANVAISRARIEGDKRVPEIQREASLSVHSRTSPRSLDASTSSQLTNKGNRFLDLAAASFIFPLVNRFWAHLDHASIVRGSRYKGSGSSILFNPFLLSAFLDTLAILCYCAQNSVTFQNDVIPEVTNLCLTITNTALARAAKGVDSNDQEDEGGGSNAILGASANLLLLLLDAVWQLDLGHNMLKRHGEQVNQIQTWAEALFESVEGQSGLDRSGRCSAAILLRISEMKQRIREQK